MKFMRRPSFDAAEVAERLTRAAKAAKRGNCGEALVQLEHVPDETALDQETRVWRARVKKLAARCVRDVGLHGRILRKRKKRK